MQKKSIAAIILAASLLLNGGLHFAPQVLFAAESSDEFATTEQKQTLEELAKEQAELAALQEEIEQNMVVVRNEVANLSAQNESMNLQLEKLLADGTILQEEYDVLTQELEQAKLYMEQMIEEYEKAELEVNDKQVEFEDRLVAMYKRSKQSVLEVLLDSEGITGFFTNLELLGVIGRSDEQVLEELTIARENASNKQRIAEETKVQYEAFVASKQEEINILSMKVDSAKTDISALEEAIMNRSGDLSNLQSTYSDTANNINTNNSTITDINNQIENQKQATLAARAEATRAAERARALAATKAAEEERARVATQAAEELRARARAAAEATEAARAEASRLLTQAATEAAAESARLRSAQLTQAAAEAQAKATNDYYAQLTAAAARERTRLAEEAQKLAEQQEAEEANTVVEPTTAPAPVVSAGYTFPAPGNYSISSPYGYRSHPISGYYEFHTGIDLPGYFSDPIVAVQSGTVVTVSAPYQGSSWGGWGYGNYIVVQHDNGIRSLYAHLKTANVSVGQYVSQGQRIGGMGSTGNSTGCHLHFEIQLPSGGGYSHTNPYSYIFG